MDFPSSQTQGCRNAENQRIAHNFTQRVYQKGQYEAQWWAAHDTSRTRQLVLNQVIPINSFPTLISTAKVGRQVHTKTCNFISTVFVCHVGLHDYIESAKFKGIQLAGGDRERLSIGTSRIETPSIIAINWGYTCGHYSRVGHRVHKRRSLHGVQQSLHSWSNLLISYTLLRQVEK